MRNPETVLVRVVTQLLERAEALGLDRAGLVRLAGLGNIETKDPDARVPVSQEVALWHLMALHASDPAFGIKLGASVEVRSLGLVGYAMYYSSTLGEALKRLVRFGRLVNEATRLTLEVTEPHLALTASDPYEIGVGTLNAILGRIASHLNVQRQELVTLLFS